MKFIVNENCIGCGLCVGTCPEIFSMTDNGVAIASPLDAMNGCPVQAIEQE